MRNNWIIEALKNLPKKECLSLMKRRRGDMRTALSKLNNQNLDTPDTIARPRYDWEFEKAFLTLLKKSKRKAFNFLKLTQKDEEGCNTLQKVAQCLSKEYFLALLEKNDSKAINWVLPDVNNEGCTTLQTILRYQNELSIQAFLKKSNKKSINRSLTQANNNGWNSLHTAIFMCSEPTFLALLAKCTTQKISLALSKTILLTNWNTLQLATNHLTEKSFLALLEKSDPIVVNTALCHQSNDSWNALQLTACYQTEMGFLSLLAKSSEEAVSIALTQINIGGFPVMGQNPSRWNTLLIVAMRQTEKAFLALVEKSNGESLAEALIQQDEEGTCTLQLLLYKYRNNSPVFFRKIFSKLDTLDFAADIITHIHPRVPFNVGKKAAKQALASEAARQLLSGKELSKNLKSIAIDEKEFFCESLLALAEQETYNHGNKIKFLKQLLDNDTVKEILYTKRHTFGFFSNPLKKQADKQVSRIKNEIKKHEDLVAHLQETGGESKIAALICNY